MKKNDIATPDCADNIYNAFNAGRLYEKKRIISLIEGLEAAAMFPSLGTCVWTQNIVDLINDDVE
jgi:hypothetical protein